MPRPAPALRPDDPEVLTAFVLAATAFGWPVSPWCPDEF